MANSLYTKAKQLIGIAGIDLSSVNFKAVLVTSGYTADLANDEFYTDLSTNHVGTDQALTGVTFTNGIFDADDVVFPTVAAGSTVSAVAIYHDTGNLATSELILLDDTVAGFPLVTSGANITIAWSNGSYKIFSL